MVSNQALHAKLFELLTGGIRPSSIIGKGYKNAKKTASEFLRTQIANTTLTKESKVSTVLVTSSGDAFKKESLATSSKAYTELTAGTSGLFGCKTITDFGVWSSAFGDGYEIYVVAN